MTEVPLRNAILLALVLPLAQTTLAAQVTPKPAPQPAARGSIRIVVADSAGHPLDEAYVRIPKHDRIGFTSQDGQVVIAGLPLGPCEVTVAKKGFKAGTASISVVEDAIKVLNFKLQGEN